MENGISINHVIGALARGRITRREAVILQAARAPGFNAAILAKAMSDSAEIH